MYTVKIAFIWIKIAIYVEWSSIKNLSNYNK